ncbi:HEAT repeat domain-containing protein [Oculatella sp. FACHB-28]|uniref:HEAT repeat domain-containing protein n=1 Tax=Oculatella sp. FACHB-28 TaxID=2692845 RepID=UPI0016893121|nr:HEAT repeat domain-containing protein [Oculatella sp. FACHB-28]MBD2060609.1 HEAT repeat domain-containing protein [Oculatella sp. FACHB-28]
MIALNNCQSYLQEICCRYEQWWTENALTEAISARQATFSFEQMVQTEEKDSEGEPRKTLPLPIFQAIQNYVESEHILLVGSPGVGKSTALLRCLVQVAERERGKLKPRIPVLVSLKRYKVSFSNPEDPSGMLTLIRNALPPKIRRKVGISEVEELLFDKRLILFLDGLNEISVDTVRTYLKAFREECQYSQVPLVCTTRELGSGDLGIKRKLKIQPLESQEIERFLQECIPEQNQKILQLLNRDKRELSRTPFVLWILYDLFQKQGTEVETLAEAFRKFFRSFNKNYREDIPVTDERRKDWNSWLKCLAFSMLDTPDLNDPVLVISREQAKQVLDDQFGKHSGDSCRIEELIKYHVLESINDEEINFHHQLIQEYYAAEALLERLQKHPEWLERTPKQKWTRFQQDYLNYLEWTEAIALMFGLPEIEAQAEQLVNLALDVDLYLAARLAGEFNLKVQKKTINLLITECTKRDLPLLFKVTYLNKSHSKHSTQVLIKALHEGDAEVQEKALEGLREIADTTVIHDLLWVIENSDGYPSIMNAIELLTALDLDKSTSSKLRELLRSQYPGTREVAALALGKLNTEACIPDLTLALRDPAIRVRRAAISVLGEIGYEEIIPDLLKILSTYGEEYNESIFSTAAFALAKLDAERAFLHPNARVRSTVISLLNKQNIENEFPKLRAAMKDESFLVRGEAIGIVGRLRISELTEELFLALEDPDSTVKMQAAYALGQLCGVEIIPKLIEELRTKNAPTRRAVIDTIRSLDREEGVPVLFLTLVDSDESVRRSALYALGELGRRNAIPHFIEILLDFNDKHHRNLIENYLQELEPQRKLELVEQINSQDSHIRWNAVKTLAKIASHAAIPELIKDFSEEKRVGQRLRLIGFLRCTSSEEVLPTLLDALDDEEVSVRRHAAFAIEHLGNLSHLHELWQQQTQKPLEAIDSAIAAIQLRCGLHNDEVNQFSRTVLRIDKTTTESFLDTINQTTQLTYKKINQMADQPKVEMNFHAPVENAVGIVEGDMVINTSPSQDKGAATAISNLLNHLRQKYPNATDEEIYGILLQGFQAMPKKNPQNWKRWQDILSVFFSGGIEATKVLVPVAGIPIEVLKRLYEIYDRNRKQLPDS